MRNFLYSQSFFLPLLLAFLLTVGVHDVSAQQVTGKGLTNRPSVTTQDGKLRACQARESTIKTRMTHLFNLAINMETKFDNHAARVENY